MKKIITHNGDFHADDVFAVAAIQIYLEKQGLVLDKDFEIIRTDRDQDFSWVTDNDIIMDVGFVYDEAKNKFDHHQASFNEKQEFEIPYSSFGLVWRKFGKSICDDNDFANSEIRRKLVCGIDAVDNGISISKSLFENIPPFSIDQFIRSYYPSIFLEEEMEKVELEKIFLTGFLRAKDFAKDFLLRYIEKEIELQIKKIEFLDTLNNPENILEINTKNKGQAKVFVLNKIFNWKLSLNFLPYPNDISFIISKRPSNKWQIVGVRKEIWTLESKILPPEKWRGEKEEGLEKISGIIGFTFCHKGGFLMSGKSKEIMLEVIKNI